MTGEGVFTDGRVAVWRRLAERENGVFEFGGERFHVKRYLRDGAGQVAGEVGGIGRLVGAGIETVELVAWGVLGDGRGYTITRDLGAGWVSGQAFLREGGRFEEIAGVTAGLAARLHAAGLHHRDLYLCHFFVKRGSDEGVGWGVRLIDAGRVGRLSGWGWGWGGGVLWRRWVVKDLAQFVYSLREFAVAEGEVREWLGRYAAAGGPAWGGMWSAVVRKADRIGRHDRRLRADRPGRSVSIPASLAGRVDKVER